MEVAFVSSQAVEFINVPPEESNRKLYSKYIGKYTRGL